ncbi:MAG: hypothetical protein LC655_03390, partial [Bacteroidales bacterium]|nr:hypothetical protein [Bacteroidales bacterium]
MTALRLPPLPQENRLMAEYDDTIVSEHDGIQEQDNKLPRWWVLLFQISIVFALLYMMWYHVLGVGRGQEKKYDDMMAQVEAAQQVRMKQMMASMDFSVP